MSGAQGGKCDDIADSRADYRGMTLDWSVVPWLQP